MAIATTCAIAGNLPQRKNQSSQLSPSVQKPDRDGLSGANLKKARRALFGKPLFYNLNTLEPSAPGNVDALRRHASNAEQSRHRSDKPRSQERATKQSARQKSKLCNGLHEPSQAAKSPWHALSTRSPCTSCSSLSIRCPKTGHLSWRGCARIAAPLKLESSRC